MNLYLLPIDRPQGACLRPNLLEMGRALGPCRTVSFVVSKGKSAGGAVKKTLRRSRRSNQLPVPVWERLGIGTLAKLSDGFSALQPPGLEQASITVVDERESASKGFGASGGFGLTIARAAAPKPVKLVISLVRYRVT
ncbi:hypothetical protein H112_00925 [Trichophyton rubrum D6]|nr:hypothetical protein H107_00973 [Trichophyton rubrum CBS 202.88]KDB37824.1 hypothetical protein H112_00925 [Trichophyton rubrum D6]KMQ42068.1 hypothetical protein HL42_7236 [Trichophyton rubrum]